MDWDKHKGCTYYGKKNLINLWYSIDLEKTDNKKKLQKTLVYKNDSFPCAPSERESLGFMKGLKLQSKRNNKKIFETVTMQGVTLKCIEYLVICVDEARVKGRAAIGRRSRLWYSEAR